MVKTNTRDTINNVADLLDAIIDEGYIPMDYTLDDLMMIRESLEETWKQLEDGYTSET